jgi:hypothetical protein
MTDTLVSECGYSVFGRRDDVVPGTTGRTVIIRESG